MRADRPNLYKNGGNAMKKYVSAALVAIMILCTVALSSCVAEDGFVYSEVGDGWSVSAARYSYELQAYVAYIDIPSEFQGKPVTEIATGGFSGWDALFSVSIPGSIKSIPSYAFGSCENLNEVSIAEGVERIERYAFANCQNLETVRVPSSVKFIGSSAFGLCTSINTVIYDGTVEEWHSIEKEEGWFDATTTFFSWAVSCNDGVVVY